MIPMRKTLLAAFCSVAFAGATGAAVAAEPDDPKVESAETHHGGGDAMKHDRTAHPVPGPDPHDHDPGEHSHEAEGDAVHGPRCGPSTGNPDQDYALAVRHHHRMAIEAAQAEIAGGTDAAMKAIAQDSIAVHEAALARLDPWLAAQGVHPDRRPACGMHWGPDGRHGRPTIVTLDADGDGFIEHAELVDTHPLHESFELIDTNKDGMLDRGEIRAYHESLRDGDTADRLTAAPHPTMPPDASMFASLDDNGDGFLVQSELATTDMLYQHFAVADANKDGRLTLVEVDAHHAAMHAEHQH